ncbi:RpS10 [Symbiodinium sp. CCMP2592]|nr:RpS10 [Symbiodinium sp. CCMP2592]
MVLIPKKSRRAILEHLFKEGVMVVKKDYQACKHNELEDIPNLHVMMVLRSLASRNYLSEIYSWQWHYYTLTNEGIEYLREVLHLPQQVFPQTLTKQRPTRPALAGGDSSEGKGKGKGKGWNRDREEDGNISEATRRAVAKRIELNLEGLDIERIDVMVLIPKKSRRAILEHLFKEGVMVVKKDYQACKHNELEDIPNLHVMMVLRSLASRNYLSEIYSWQWHYYTLTNEGIEYLREVLHLPQQVFPQTLTKQRPTRPALAGGDSSEGKGKGKGKGWNRDREEEG